MANYDAIAHGLHKLDANLPRRHAAVTGDPEGSIQLVHGHDQVYTVARKRDQYSVKIAHHVMEKDLNLKAAALELGYVSEEEFDRLVDPAKMVHPYVAQE